MSHSSDFDATTAEGRAHQIPGHDHVRPAEPLVGAHDTYEKGELSSVGNLLGDIAGDISTLMRQETALAKLEIQQSAKAAGKGAGLLGGAGVAGHFVLLFLSLALMWFLGDVMDGYGRAAVVVAVLWAIVAAILGVMGKKELDNVNGAPRTVETASKVPNALKGNEHR